MNGSVNNGVSYDSGSYHPQHQQLAPLPATTQQPPQTWAMQRQQSHPSPSTFYGSGPQIGVQQAGRPANAQPTHYPHQQPMVEHRDQPAAPPFYPQQHSYPVYQPAQAEPQQGQQLMRQPPPSLTNQVHHGAPHLMATDTQAPGWGQSAPPHQVDASYSGGPAPPPAVYSERLQSPAMNQRAPAVPTPPATTPHSYTPDPTQSISNNNNNPSHIYHNNAHQQNSQQQPAYATEASSASSTPGVSYSTPTGVYGNSEYNSSFYHQNGAAPPTPDSVAAANARACQPGTPHTYWSSQQQQQPPPGPASAPPTMHPPAPSPHINSNTPNGHQQLAPPRHQQQLPPSDLSQQPQHTPSTHYYYSRSPYDQQPPPGAYPPQPAPHLNGMSPQQQYQQFAPNPQHQEPLMHHSQHQPPPPPLPPNEHHSMQMNPHHSNHIHQHTHPGPYAQPPPQPQHMHYPNNTMHPTQQHLHHHHQQMMHNQHMVQNHHQLPAQMGPSPPRPYHQMQHQHPMQLPPPHNHPHHHHPHQIPPVNHQMAPVGIEQQQPPPPPQPTGKVRGSKKGAATGVAAAAGGTQPKSTPTRKRPYMTEKHKQSGYAKFYQIKRKELGVEDFAQASKLISDLWNKLSDEEKSVYAQDVSNKRKEMLKKKASQQAQNLLIGTRLDD